MDLDPERDHRHFLGVMPALGISTANIVAYMYEKKAASPKERETFGKGM